MGKIPPVFVLSTGRCGSTMVSDILNAHPAVLSLSEFLSYAGSGTLSRRRATGNWIWNRYSVQRRSSNLMLQGDYSELIYPFDDPGACFDRDTVPPILCVTLPHLSKQHEQLFDELEPVVRNQPKQSPADHIRALAGWLSDKYGCATWVERSGASLMYCKLILNSFPEAKFIHVYRDGRETALSMSGHHIFQVGVRSLNALKPVGIDGMAYLARGKAWNFLVPKLEMVSPLLVRSGREPSNKSKASLEDYGSLWSAMIERGTRILGSLPPEKVHNVPFRGRPGRPVRPAPADDSIHRSRSGGREVAGRGVLDSAKNVIQIRPACPGGSGDAQSVHPARHGNAGLFDVAFPLEASTRRQSLAYATET